MAKQKTDAGKEQRVVLNLNMAQANKLKDFMEKHNMSVNGEIAKIQARLEKTINKHETEKGIAGVITAAQEVIDEMDPDKRIKQLNDKCPTCGCRATLPEPDGTLLCENCGAIWRNNGN